MKGGLCLGLAFFASRLPPTESPLIKAVAPSTLTALFTRGAQRRGAARKVAMMKSKLESI